MEIYDQVCSLELARQLKDLGVFQVSKFYWYKLEKSNEWVVHAHGDDAVCMCDELSKVSAFTVSELFDLLPNDTKLYRRFHDYFICNVEIGDAPRWVHCRQDSARAVDACAKMLVYLLRNKLISGGVL